MALSGEAFQLELAALAPTADRGRHGGGAGRILLGKRIPFAAGLALALPAVIGRAAVLADEGERGFGHVGVSRRSVGCVAFLRLESRLLGSDKKFAEGS